MQHNKRRYKLFRCSLMAAHELLTGRILLSDLPVFLKWQQNACDLRVGLCLHSLMLNLFITLPPFIGYVLQHPPPPPPPLPAVNTIGYENECEGEETQRIIMALCK